jgi:hypothetical protein
MIAGCAAPNKSLIASKAIQRINSLDADSRNDINTLIAMIEEQARVTDPGEKRFIPYEFRIPLDAKKMKQIHRVDSQISFTERTDAYQCIGENATKEKILHIVSLPYTYKIKFCPYE